MHDQTGAQTLCGGAPVPSAGHPVPSGGYAVPAAPKPASSVGRRVAAIVGVLLIGALVGGLAGVWQNSAAALATPDRPDTTVTKYAVEVVWQPIDGATEYVVKRDDTEVYAGLATSFKDPLPLPGVYQYSVSARSSDALPSRFSLKSTPTTVFASWRQVQWIADLYPDLVPASPLSTNGFDQVGCFANASIYFDKSSRETITCQKVNGVNVDYSFAVYGFPGDPAGRADAQPIIFRRSLSRPFTSAQGNPGTVHQYEQNGMQCAGVDFDGEKRALTLVEVCVTKGSASDAVRLARRVPM